MLFVVGPHRREHGVASNELIVSADTFPNVAVRAHGHSAAGGNGVKNREKILLGFRSQAVEQLHGPHASDLIAPLPFAVHEGFEAIDRILRAGSHLAHVSIGEWFASPI